MGPNEVHTNAGGDAGDGWSGPGLAAGVVLAGYRVERLLGLGRDAEVWLARVEGCPPDVATGAARASTRRRLRRAPEVSTGRTATSPLSIRPPADTATATATATAPATSAATADERQPAGREPDVLVTDRFCADRSGELVAVRWVNGGAEDRRRRSLLASAHAWGAVRHPHVVRLRAVLQGASGAGVVMDYAAGGSLAALLTARRRLSPGEVVTIGAPLAVTLSDLHRWGLSHGDVSIANVLFELDGRPLLVDPAQPGEFVGADAGARSQSAGGSDTSPVDAEDDRPHGLLRPGQSVADVSALAGVCMEALAGRRPPPEGAAAADLLRSTLVPQVLADSLLAAWTCSGRGADPVTFASRLRSAAAPLPVALVPDVELQAVLPTYAGSRSEERAPQVSAVSVGGSRKRMRPIAFAIMATALVALVSVVAWRATSAATGPATVYGASRDRPSGVPVASGPSTQPAESIPDAGPPPTAGAPLGSEAPPMAEPAAACAGPAPVGVKRVEFAQIVRQLDDCRTEAYTATDPLPLGQVYTSGSVAMQSERAAINILKSAGLHPDGYRPVIVTVAVVTTTGGQVELKVTDRIPPYDLVDAAGLQAEHRPGRGDRNWRMTLAQVAGRWLVTSVRPA